MPRRASRSPTSGGRSIGGSFSALLTCKGEAQQGRK
jgi:hypothetical protein